VIASQKSGTDPTGTPWEACGSSARFVNDGYEVLDESFATTSEHYLMTDFGYDPTVDPGPDAHPVPAGSSSCTASTWSHYFQGEVIDWTHENSLAVSTTAGGVDVLDISLHAWSQIIRVEAETGAYLWSLAGDSGYSDRGRLRMESGIGGKPTFSGQHDVHPVGTDELLMLDNQGDPGGPRVLRIDIASRPTIDRSWAMVDALGAPLDCPVEGSAEEVPGTSGDNVLAACQNEYTVTELDDSMGYPGTSTIHPPLVVSLPDGTTDDFCTTGGPSARQYLRGFYRAYPLAVVGDFP
jgi:hypothetical protein